MVLETKCHSVTMPQAILKNHWPKPGLVFKLDTVSILIPNVTIVFDNYVLFVYLLTNNMPKLTTDVFVIVVQRVIKKPFVK